jgi:hypothetical protein
LKVWQKDRYLEPVREPKWIRLLPDQEEQKEWEKFWQEVRDLEKKAEESESRSVQR